MIIICLRLLLQLILRIRTTFPTNVNPCVYLVRVFVLVSTLTSSGVHARGYKADALYHFDWHVAYMLLSRCLADRRQMLQTHEAHAAFTSPCWETLLGLKPLKTCCLQMLPPRISVQPKQILVYVSVPKLR